MLETLKTQLKENTVPIPESGCLVWLGGTVGNGYGRMLGGAKGYYAHRVSYELNNGTIPQGSFVLHKCDIPCCVNPEHLYLGNQTDNMQDAKARNRLSSPPVHLGTKNNKCKLTESDVINIRKLKLEKRLTNTNLASMFGVSDCMIGLIVRRINWRHI